MLVLVFSFVEVAVILFIGSLILFIDWMRLGLKVVVFLFGKFFFVMNLMIFFVGLKKYMV